MVGPPKRDGHLASSDSAEGQALLGFLQKNGIPYLAFRSAIPPGTDWSTHPHRPPVASLLILQMKPITLLLILLGTTVTPERGTRITNERREVFNRQTGIALRGARFEMRRA